MLCASDPPLRFFGIWDFPYLKAWDWESLKAKSGRESELKYAGRGGGGEVGCPVFLPDRGIAAHFLGKAAP